MSTISTEHNRTQPMVPIREFPTTSLKTEQLRELPTISLKTKQLFCSLDSKFPRAFLPEHQFRWKVYMFETSYSLIETATISGLQDFLFGSLKVAFSVALVAGSIFCCTLSIPYALPLGLLLLAISLYISEDLLTSKYLEDFTHFKLKPRAYQEAYEEYPPSLIETIELELIFLQRELSYNFDRAPILEEMYAKTYSKLDYDFESARTYFPQHGQGLLGKLQAKTPDADTKTAIRELQTMLAYYQQHASA